MEYREIPGHSKDYLAGSDGAIYSLKSGEPIALTGRYDGQKKYLHVWAYPDGRDRVTRNIHSLMCLAFHGPKPSTRHTASHLNGDSLDNRPDNLAWELYSENLDRKNEHGTHDRGLNNSRACLTEDSLAEVRLLLSEGNLTQQQIADKVGISRTMVSRIKTGKKYRD